MLPETKLLGFVEHWRPRFCPSCKMSSSSATGLTCAGAILPALSIVIVGLRFYARRQQRVKIKIDDVMTLPALVSPVSLLVFGAVAQCSVKRAVTNAWYLV